MRAERAGGRLGDSDRRDEAGRSQEADEHAFHDGILRGERDRGFAPAAGVVRALERPPADTAGACRRLAVSVATVAAGMPPVGKPESFPVRGSAVNPTPRGAATVARHRPPGRGPAQGRRWYRRRLPALPSPAMARKLLKRTAVVIVVALLTLLAVRAWDSTRGAPLEPWHTFVPTELSGEGARPGRLGEVRRGRERDLRPGERRGDAQAPRGRARALEPLLRGQPRLSAALPARLEPVVRARARRDAARRGRAPARAHRFALQPASHRAALPRARLRRGRDPPARPRHRSRRLTDVEWEEWLAATRLAVREARRRAGPAGAAAHRRLLERWRARDEVRARRARRPRPCRGPTGSC